VGILGYTIHLWLLSVTAAAGGPPESSPHYTVRSRDLSIRMCISHCSTTPVSTWQHISHSHRLKSRHSTTVPVPQYHSTTVPQYQYHSTTVPHSAVQHTALDVQGSPSPETSPDLSDRLYHSRNQITSPRLLPIWRPQHKTRLQSLQSWQSRLGDCGSSRLDRAPANLFAKARRPGLF